MDKRPTPQRNYYFPQRLRRQFAQIPLYPLTLIEAPSGFGKTTAVREYLRESLPEGARAHWYTCLGEPAQAAWLGICELFSPLGAQVADRLRGLKMPTFETLYALAACLGELSCPTETYLVVDNYQLVDCEVPRALMAAFAAHGNPRLHMIFITQQIRAEHQAPAESSGIHTIGAPAFFFDRESTAALFRQEGLSLAPEELETLYRGTEGWIAALRLQLIHYRETGRLDHAADMAELVERAVWNRLSPPEQDFLLAVSALESFTPQQAAIMLGEEMLPPAIRQLLRQSEFIRFVPDQHQYTLHSIFSDYLRSRFEHELPPGRQAGILRRAGQACAVRGQYYPAAEFFYRVRDFDALLRLPFSCRYFYQNREACRPQLIEALLDPCPPETLAAHPSALILFAFKALALGRRAIFEALFRRLDALPLCSELAGERALLAALARYDDPAAFHAGLAAAWQALGGPSRLFADTPLWEYAGPSLLSLWRWRPGGLDEALRHGDGAHALYRRLTQVQGAGADSAVRAEAALLRGEGDEAEILCHKALYDDAARTARGPELCARLTLARAAILRGDGPGYERALEALKALAGGGGALSRPAECGLSLLGLLLGAREQVAPWLAEPEEIRSALFAPAVPTAQALYLQLLLRDRRYRPLYGFCRLDPGAALLPRLNRLIVLALAKRGDGKPAEARELLKQALELALPDRLHLPFAQQPGMPDFLSELNLPALFAAHSPEGPAGAAGLIALCDRWQKGLEAVRQAVFQAPSPLTPREREIAGLAGQRLSAREIAQQLYISEMTVRATLRSVYSKLDIHSKAELALRRF